MGAGVFPEGSSNRLWWCWGMLVVFGQVRWLLMNAVLFTFRGNRLTWERPGVVWKRRYADRASKVISNGVWAIGLRRQEGETTLRPIIRFIMVMCEALMVLLHQRS